LWDKKTTKTRRRAQHLTALELRYCKKDDMENIDLSILQKAPELSQKAKVIIEPLAPISMVSDLPGSFYKSLKSPSKKMLCGLFENLLGWHIDIADRKEIQKDMINVRQKGIKNKDERNAIKLLVENHQKGSSYIPLLMEYFEIELVTLPPMIHYNDLWSKAYRRADADVHPKGTPNISYELIPEKRERNRDEKKPKQIAGVELLKLFKSNLGKFPLYYSTPTSREFVDFNSATEIIISIDVKLSELIKKNININNCLYLGNSEGWVNLKMEKL
jgi:CRISPR-associated protein Cas5